MCRVWCPRRADCLRFVTLVSRRRPRGSGRMRRVRNKGAQRRGGQLDRSRCFNHFGSVGVNHRSVCCADSFAKPCPWCFGSSPSGRHGNSVPLSNRIWAVCSRTPSVAPWVGRLVILVLVLLAGWVVGMLLSYFTRSLGLGIMDRGPRPVVRHRARRGAGGIDDHRRRAAAFESRRLVGPVEAGSLRRNGRRLAAGHGRREGRTLGQARAPDRSQSQTQVAEVLHVRNRRNGRESARSINASMTR